MSSQENRKSFSSLWLRPVAHRDSDTKLRLYCFHHAGGSADMFQHWTRYLPSAIEIYAVQLPGRANRIDEPLIESIEELAIRLFEPFRLSLNGTYAVMGVSMGATLAFELCRLLKDSGHELPRHFFLMGRSPPQVSYRSRLTNDLSDLQILNAYDEGAHGIPRDFLRDPDFVEMAARVLKADLVALENYHFAGRAGFPFPITAFGGDRDTVSPFETLKLWAAHTTGDFKLEPFQGGHFAFRDMNSPFFEKLSRELLILIESLASVSN